MAPSSILGFWREHLYAQRLLGLDHHHHTGIGLETARWFAKLNAARVILAVRNTSKGEAAAKDILASLDAESRCRVEVWALYLASAKSVEAFATRVQNELDRLDILLSNAAVFLYEFSMADGNETTVTVNVINTLMLAFLLLPKLRKTSVAFDRETKLAFTGSFAFWLTPYPERNFPHIFSGLADETKARMDDRYFVTKITHLPLTREFAKALSDSSKPGNVTTTVVNPGHVKTEILRHMNATKFAFVKQWQRIGARTSEQAGRILIHAAEGGSETHGNLSPFLQSQESFDIQKKLWAELGEILEAKHPGIMGII
ncbi:putative short-chain dehydrogenase [Ilyonectria destructans]|nr:putative short-chain dehydrogenase [Ilyonectria destructans]